MIIQQLKVAERSRRPEATKPVILNTYNFQAVQKVCSHCIERKKMATIIGESGYGKTVALEYFRNTHPNTVMITAKPSMSAKTFWLEILESITKDESGKGKGIEFSKRTLYQILRQVSREFNALPNTLLIVDECGKLNDKMLGFLHEVRDETKLNAGIVLSGPPYFRDNLIRWSNTGKLGMAEIMRRINSWYNLEAPTLNEVRKLCEVRGIKDLATIKTLAERCRNFGQLDNEINEIIEDQPY